MYCFWYLIISELMQLSNRSPREGNSAKHHSVSRDRLWENPHCYNASSLLRPSPPETVAFHCCFLSPTSGFSSSGILKKKEHTHSLTLSLSLYIYWWVFIQIWQKPKIWILLLGQWIWDSLDYTMLFRNFWPIWNFGVVTYGCGSYCSNALCFLLIYVSLKILMDIGVEAKALKIERFFFCLILDAEVKILELLNYGFLR